MTGPKVLIITTDQDILERVGTELRTAGLQLIVARDAPSALLLGQKQRPSAIIVDLDLPGSGGFKLLQRLKSLAPLAGIPIVVLTGRILDPDEEDRLEIYARARLEKPVSIEVLNQTLRTMLGDFGPPARDLGPPRA
ncbi:MAG: response regulator [Gemmatimonadota bacterium]|nr:MAG: response regulator [Gemmatimonadota bacterium]